MPDGRSSDASSNELERPSLLRFTASDVTPAGDADTDAYGRSANLDEEPRFMSSSKLENDRAAVDVEKPEDGNDDLISWADNTASATRLHRWSDGAQASNVVSQHSNSDTSLLASNM